MFRNWKIKIIFIALGGFIVLFIVAPIIGVYLKTSFEDYGATLADEQVRRSIGLTLYASMAGTVLFGIGAIPLAYILARKSFPLKGIVNGIIDLPVIIPHSAAGIALLGVISRNTLVGQAGESVGISFVGGIAGIVVAMAFVSIPFLINAARDGFASVPERLEKAALNLGASPLKVFFTISLPLAKKHIITGLTMMWARGLSEFGAVIIIAYHPMVTPVLIWERFASYGLQFARPIAAIYMAVCLIIFVAMRLLTRNTYNAKTR